MTFRAMNRVAALVCVLFFAATMGMASLAPGGPSGAPSPALASFSPLSVR